MTDWDPLTEGEMYMLIKHCIEQLPSLEEKFVCDCMDDPSTTVSFESPNFVLTMKLERKEEAK